MTQEGLEYHIKQEEGRLATEIANLRDTIEEIERGKLYRGRHLGTYAGEIAQISGKLISLREVQESLKQDQTRK